MRNLGNLDSTASKNTLGHSDISLNRGVRAPEQQSFASFGRETVVAPQDHLASAKRLSRAMRRIPINSKQHIRAGRLVCRHLIEMLHDSPIHNPRIQLRS